MLTKRLRNKDKINLNLRIDDNIKPILYIENSNLQGNACRSKFIDDKKLLDDNSTDWSKDISLNFPVINGKNVGYYAKLCYYRHDNNENSPNTILKNEKYYSNAFCPINLKTIVDINYTFQQCFHSDFIYCKGKLPNNNNNIKFSYVAEAGVNWDTNRIIFYSKFVFKN